MIDRHARTRVYGPTESREEDAFYERKKGLSGRDPVNFTAFREAERRFKTKAGHLDLSGVLDLRCPAQHDSMLKRKRIICQGLRTDKELWLYDVVGAEGFCVIPNALDDVQQKYWITTALSSYMRPPNTTNLDAHYEIPSNGLWHSFLNRQTLEIRRIPHPDDSAKKLALPLELSLDPEQIEQLIRSIRWVTLGYQYDWTSKQYDFVKSPAVFPTELAEWSRSVSEAAGFGPFTAEAGIVNFYQHGDTLTGHVDRSEPNMSAPLISLSLGAECIFLLGGADRNDPVIPMILRSGDVLLMTGLSRLFYHGVPRILETETRLSYNPSHDEPDSETALCLLGGARININIRQVNP